MWLAQGPFGAGVVAKDQNTQVSKVLKTNEKYAVGRKQDFPLCIDSKKVSNNHCAIIVGEFSEDDMTNPEVRPRIQLQNTREGSKGIGVGAKGDQDLNNVELVAEGATYDLTEGQEVRVVSFASIGIIWTEVCCFIAPPRPGIIPTEDCRKLGVHLTPILRAGVTHHVASVYSPTVQMAASLINGCNFVKVEWLNDLATAVDSCVNFELPQLSKHRPTFSPALEARHKRFEVWEASSKRRRIFKSLRFICVGEKNREIDSQLRFMIESGGGTIETFDVKSSACKTKWNRALSRGKAKAGKTLVVLGDEQNVTAAIGKDGWKELVEENEGFGLVFKSTNDVILSVLDNNISNLESGIGVEDDEGHRSSSPIPDVIPNSMPDEQTNPPQTHSPAIEEASPPRRRPPRRTSRQPSEQPGPSVIDPISESSQSRPTRRSTRQSSQPPEPSAPSAPPARSEPEPEAPRRPPRRIPTRRVDIKTGEPIVTGLGDSSVLNDAPVVTPMTTQPSVPIVIDYTASSRTRTLPRPKRRLEATDFGSREGSAAPEERVTKKYRSLFEESGPAKDTTSSLSDLMNSAVEETQLSQTMARSKSKPVTQATALDAVPEEMEMSETQTTGSTLNPSNSGRKRKAVAEEDEEMDGVEQALAPSGTNSQTGSARPPPSKRLAVENVNSVDRTQESMPTSAKPPSTLKSGSASGAEPGKPDTDEAFLKAVASTKRGKKNEDEFDREFNKLKISKPELAQEDQEDRQWAVLEDFGDDSNIRGNFMMIVEFDAPRHRVRAPQERNPEWDGKPNFKKFKKKNAGSTNVRPRRVELVLNEQHAYGLGAGYWKEENSSQVQNFDESQSLARTTQSPAVVIHDSDSDDGVVQSKRKTTVPAKKTRGTTKKSQPLFLEDSESDHEAALKDEDQSPDATLESEPPPTNKPARNARSRRAQPIVVDDDSDDDAMFKGRRAKGRRR
ncbi:hypothetical protein PQX77_006330 [Marasmius sp. AFHP31]|nr:hypothetical protein PQX77_006330 [Marasmius sp. AFHP31]